MKDQLDTCMDTRPTSPSPTDTLKSSTPHHSYVGASLGRDTCNASHFRIAHMRDPPHISLMIRALCKCLPLPLYHAAGISYISCAAAPLSGHPLAGPVSASHHGQ